MKIYLSGQIIVASSLILVLAELSDAVSLPGVAASSGIDIAHKVQGSAENTSTSRSYKENSNTTFESFKYKYDYENPQTLREYLIDHEGSDETLSQNVDLLLNNQSSGNVNMIARIGDYENENNPRTNEFKSFSKNQSIQNKTENFSNIGSSNINETQKYINDYQDLFFSFKDFVNIGINPNVKRNTTNTTLFNSESGKNINVTYIMPIPKTKKYFQINISNLTENQYKDMNMLLLTYLKNRANNFSQKREDEIVYIDREDTRSQVTSRDLTEHDSLSTFPPNTMGDIQLPGNPDQAMVYFKNLFNEKDYGNLLKILKTTPLNSTSKPKSDSENFTNLKNRAIIKNNGFHAEISTDYIPKSDNIQENKNMTLNNSFSNNKIFNKFTSQQSELKSQEAFTETATTILNPVYIGRNITKLRLKSRPKLTFSYNSPISQRTNTNSNMGTHIAHKNLSSLPNHGLQSVKSEMKFNMMDITTSSTTFNNQTMSEKKDIPQKDGNEYFPTVLKENLTKLIDLDSINFRVNQNDLNTSEIYKKIMDKNVSLPLSNHSNATDEILDIANTSPNTTSLGVIQAANWIIEIKKRLEDEERKKNERYKSYIKQFLRNESDLAYLSENLEGSSVMKINRQDNTLEELKQLMVDYFTSMDFIDRGTAQKNSSLEVESIMNVTNIFELMNISSQLMRVNLQMRKQNNSMKPSGFLKKIMERQVEKCSKFFDKSFFNNKKQKTQALQNQNKNREFMMFTNCVNFKLQKCIKDFSAWLKKGRFYLRTQFKLSRAYQNYEIEKNLYCLRIYNASSLDSNHHGVRVWPKGAMHRGQGRNKTKLQMRRPNIRNKAKHGQKKESDGNHSNRNGNVNIRVNNHGVRKSSHTPRRQKLLANKTEWKTYRS